MAPGQLQISQEIRRNFLSYFKEKLHSIIPSSPVIPHDDPTLLFINAGMNQFKDVFLGRRQRDYTKAATSQKCIRAGGKHNDLENVGHTSRHMTFFEMLGNFSFGDYFKEQAIQFAWEVSTQVFGLDPKRIRATVFREDDEAALLWQKYLPASKIFRLDETDNFWAMGDTGPCGPCSELLYDRGDRFGNGTTPLEDPSGERFLEYWNLVFMQYDRDSNGKLSKLPKQSIDTGAGLERVVSLKMDEPSIFTTDILRSLIAQIENVSGAVYQSEDSLNAPPFHVIADHLRCLSFAIADGAQPSNVDRGYVLRKILRRAVRYGRQIGFEEPFLAKILPRLVATMGDDYHELKDSQMRIAEILTIEEEAFFRTLKRGGNLLNQIVSQATAGSKKISGEDAFKLKDTYGLPIDEILLLAKDSTLDVDLEKYKVLEEEAKERSKSAQKAIQQTINESDYTAFVQKEGESIFLGNQSPQVEAIITGLFVDGQLTDHLKEGQTAVIILDRTPFYPEKGGQIGDKGDLTSSTVHFEVHDTQTPHSGVIEHRGILKHGSIKKGDQVLAKIDLKRRQKIESNHTATHLLHWALHQILGAHIKQAGSVVDEERLRFDFSHHKALTDEEIQEIENLVNQKIRENQIVECYVISYEEAQKKREIKQFFGEKYGSEVRVVDIDYSKELCGGTHTSRVGNIGYFRIVKESSIAAGIRRIEAVTGEAAETFSKQFELILNSLALTLKTPPATLADKVGKLAEENKNLQAELKKLRLEQIANLADSLAHPKKINQINCIFAQAPVEAGELKVLAELLLSKLNSGVVLIGSKSPEKCMLYAMVSSDWIQKGLKANELIKAVSAVIGGSGGGKADAAQAGGKLPHMIDTALEHAAEWLTQF